MHPAAPPPQRSPHGIIDLIPSADAQLWAPPETLTPHTGTPPVPRTPPARIIPTRRDSISRALDTCDDAICDTARALTRELRAALGRLHTILAPAGRVAGRFLRGEPLSGRTRTDHTFWLRGHRRHTHLDGQPGAWAYKAGIERAAVRWYLLTCAWAGGRLLAPQATLTTVEILGGLLLLSGLLRAKGTLRRRRHRRVYLRPLHTALKAAIPAMTGRTEDWLHIPPDFRSRDGELLRVRLPAHFGGNPTLEKHLTEIVSAKLGLGPQTSPRFHRQGNQPYLAYRQCASCPDVVPFADWRAQIEALSPGEIFIGLDYQHTPYLASFLTDDPHWGFEVTSRRGKSTFLSLTAAQILHQHPRATCTGIDVKRESFLPLDGVPRFTLHNDPRDILGMWAGIAAFREEMDRRSEARATDPTLDFPFNILLIDELSQFSAQSKQLWRHMRGPKDPLYPPVWDDIAAIMWQGAAYHCHVVMAGQRIDHTITGGIGLIGSMGFRGLAGFRPQNYARLIGSRPVPRSRPERGRWIYSDGNTETWVQNLWATHEEINDYASTTSAHATGEPEPMSHMSRMSRNGTVFPRHALEVPARGTHATSVTQPSAAPPRPGGRSRVSTPHHAPPAAAEARLVSLQEALELGIVPGLNIVTLRKARQRAQLNGFPPVRGRRGREKLHSETELRDWITQKYLQ